MENTRRNTTGISRAQVSGEHLHAFANHIIIIMGNVSKTWNLAKGGFSLFLRKLWYINLFMMNHRTVDTIVLETNNI